MKFACSECQAKYQIPDDRIVGRKLKIRCRKCGAVISVRGDQLGEHAAAAPEAPAPELEWHVSLQGEQHGPYLTEQMASMLRTGQLGWEAHVWHEGYADWKTADQSDTLVHAVAALGSEQRFDADDSPTRQSAPPGAELQPASGEYAAAPSFGATPRVIYPPGYGSGSPDYAVDDGGGYGGGRVSAQAMTAQRNEDSILFSAKNLQLAASSGAGSSGAPSAVAARSGYASTEGSGLIDIRALAALAATGSNGGHYAEQPAAVTSDYGPQDELPPLANHVSTFGRIDSLSPLERPAPRQSYAVPLAIVAGSALVAVAAFSAVYLTRQPAGANLPVAATAAPVAPTAPPMAAGPEAAQAPAAAPVAPADEPEQVNSAAAADDNEQAAGDDSAATHAGHASKARHERGGKAAGSVRASLAAGRAKAADNAERSAAASASAKKASVAASAKQAPAAKEENEQDKPADKPADKDKPSLGDDLFAEAKPAPAAAEPAQPAKAKEPQKSRSIDDLLDDAVVKHDKGGGAAASNLPDAPSREQVKAAMKGIESKVKACAAGQELSQPSSTVSLTVVGATGRVQAVRVTGNEGPIGSCIARAVRGATFPKFAKSDMTVNFPFMLK